MPANASNVRLLTNAAQAIPTTTSTDVVFGGTPIQNGAVDFITGAPANSVIIPSGVTHVYAGYAFRAPSGSANSVVAWLAFSQGSRTLCTKGWRRYQAGSPQRYRCPVRFYSYPIPVTVGETIKLQLWHDFGGTPNFNGAATPELDEYLFVIDATGDLA